MAKRKTAKKKNTAKKKSDWPLKRQVLYRPQRFAYIDDQRKGEYKKGDCVFCETYREGVHPEGQLLYTTPNAMVVMNKYPYNPGHVMVLPTRHEGDLLSLSSPEFEEITRLVKATIKVLKQAYQVEDFNVGMNLGKAAGAGIPEHLHVHIVPRWSGDNNFFPLIAETKVISSEPKTIFKKLAPLFDKIGQEGI